MSSLIFYIYLYPGFILSCVVFPIYALPAMRMARLLTWARAGWITALALALGLLSAVPIGFMTGVVVFDTSENGPFRFPLTYFMALLSMDGFVFGATLMIGFILYKVSNDRLLNKIALRCAVIAVAGLVLAQTPFAIRGTEITATMLLAAPYLMAIVWHVLMAIGLFKWAKAERRRWRIRNWLCVHCQYSVIGLRDTLCPECGKPWRE